MSRKWRWLLAAVMTAAVLGTWSARRADACAFVLVFGSGTDVCGPIQVAQQVTEIARMVDQLTQLTNINQMTTELVTSQDIGMGNIGRVREVNDALWWLQRDGRGLATDPQREGSFNQRITG